MTTDIFIIDHENETGAKVTFANRRLGSGEKQAFVQKLAEISPPRGTANVSVVADELGTITDQGTKTTIQARARIFIDGASHRSQNFKITINQGQETRIHPKGYGAPIESNAPIGLRNR